MAEHGQRSRYVAGCRCDDCRRANREYYRKRTMQKVAEECGAPATMVDAEPVRLKLLALYEQGYTQREVCRLTGLSRSTLRSIVVAHHRSGRPVAMVRRETKDAICAIKGRRCLSAAQRVDAEWMARQVKRYLERGLSVAQLSRAVGIDRQTLDRIAHGGPCKVEARTLHAFVSAKPACDRLLREVA